MSFVHTVLMLSGIINTVLLTAVHLGICPLAYSVPGQAGNTGAALLWPRKTEVVLFMCCRPLLPKCGPQTKDIHSSQKHI